MAADFGDAVLEFANRKYQRGLQEAEAGWQNEQRGRQRKKWSEEDDNKAILKEANQAAADHYKSRMTAQQGDSGQPIGEQATKASQSLGDAIAPISTEQVSLQPPQQSRGLSAASLTPAQDGAPMGLSASQPPAQPAAQDQPLSASMGRLSLGEAATPAANPTAMPEPARAAPPAKINEGQAIFEAASKRGDVLLKHGRYDDFMANHAKQAELGSQLLGRAAQEADAAYQQTGDPTEYIKRMSPYANTGIDFVRSERKGVDKDGQPIWSVTTTSNGEETTQDIPESRIIEGANRLRDPKYAQELALKGGIAQVQARAKMAEQDNKGKNDRLTEGVKSKNERQLEEDRQKGRMSLSAANASNSIKVNRSKASGDGEVKPKDQLASIDSQRREIQDNRELLFREYQEALGDDTLDDDQKKVVRASYERQVAGLNAASTDLGRQRKILESKVSLNGDAPAKTKGLSSAKSASKAPGAKPGTKTPTISGW